MSQEFPGFLDSVCESLDAVSRLTRSSLMVFDFVKSEIVYHSRKLLFIDGDIPGGVNPYWSIATEDSLGRVAETKGAYLRLLPSFSPEMKTNHACVMDLNIICSGRERAITQKFTPLKFGDDGRLVLGLFSIAPCMKPGDNVTVFGDDFRFRYDWAMKEFIPLSQCVRLTSAEKEILILALEGLTTKEIAKDLCRSENTVKTHKERLFDKLQISSLSEAYLYVTNHMLD